jgi:ribonuclease P protein component
VQLSRRLARLAPQQAKRRVVVAVPPSTRIGRIVHRADFERLMSTRALSRSAHFALHYAAGAPAEPKVRHIGAGGCEISTANSGNPDDAVDKCSGDVWIGAMVPKRHAKRAVTRTLLKRQIRFAFQRHRESLAPGLWLVRLRRAFAPAEFVSARSERLMRAVREELDRLFGPAALPRRGCAVT